MSEVGGRRGRVRSLCMSTNLLEYEYKSAEKEGRRESSAESLHDRKIRIRIRNYRFIE